MKETGEGINEIEKEREGRNKREKDGGGRDEGVFISMFLMPDIKNVVLIPQVNKILKLSSCHKLKFSNSYFLAT